MEQKTISIQVKTVYGNDLNYPACETARIFAGLLGRKTLTCQDLQFIKRLGYAVIYEYARHAG